MEKNLYRKIKSPINSKMIVVQNKEYQWGVIDENDNIVVPFGKYAWIDGFQNGLAKVIGYNDTTSPNVVAVIDLNNNIISSPKESHEEQGIINESGEVVLPLEYNIWKFYGKNYSTIQVFKGGQGHGIRYESLNPDLIEELEIDNDFRYNHYVSDEIDYQSDTWDAMTDGMYGDMPDGFDGDYDFLGF